MVACDRKAIEFICTEGIRNIPHDIVKVRVRLRITMETRDMNIVKSLTISWPLGFTVIITSEQRPDLLTSHSFAAGDRQVFFPMLRSLVSLH